MHIMRDDAPKRRGMNCEKRRFQGMKASHSTSYVGLQTCDTAAGLRAFTHVWYGLTAVDNVRRLGEYRAHAPFRREKGYLLDVVSLSIRGSRQQNALRDGHCESTYTRARNPFDPICFKHLGEKPHTHLLDPFFSFLPIRRYHMVRHSSFPVSLFRYASMLAAFERKSGNLRENISK